MTPELKAYEKTIKKTHRIAWTPKFELDFRTQVSQAVFVEFATQALAEMGAEIVYQGDNIVEARTKTRATSWGQEMWVTYQYGKVQVKSKSSGNEVWDNGRNSKNVQLFAYAFRQIESGHDAASLSSLDQDLERRNNWDDYEEPASLPSPPSLEAASFGWLVAGGLLVAVVLGLIVAYLYYLEVYVGFVVEVGVGLAISFTLAKLFRWTSYMNFTYVHYLLIGMVVLTYCCTYFFRYVMLVSEEPLSFWTYLQLRWKAGLFIGDASWGGMALLLSWGVQWLVTYGIAIANLATKMIAFQVDQVPVEVMDFTSFHIFKGKTETELRSVLAAKGWTQAAQQDLVFDALEAVQEVSEWQRLEKD